jgi:hypothetical protein
MATILILDTALQVPFPVVVKVRFIPPLEISTAEGV